MKGQVFGAWLTMMRLGSFKFGIATAAYQALDRSTDYNFGEQQLFGQLDDLQFLGPGSDMITLAGVIYTNYRGGTQQIETLRALAEQGQPQMLISATGKVFGLWVITNITEGQSKFAAMGVPQKQEFSVSLRKYSNQTNQLGLVDSVLGSINRF